jgi:hypothetical protein
MVVMLLAEAVIALAFVLLVILPMLLYRGPPQ